MIQCNKINHWIVHHMLKILYYNIYSSLCEITSANKNVQGSSTVDHPILELEPQMVPSDISEHYSTDEELAQFTGALKAQTASCHFQQDCPEDTKWLTPRDPI